MFARNKIAFAILAFLISSVASPRADAAKTWKAVSPSSVAGGSTACSTRFKGGYLNITVPVATTIYYNLIGGGSGGGFSVAPGGAGGATAILVNNTLVASAAGGTINPPSDGATANGSVTIAQGQNLKLIVGGGGGGGTNWSGSWIPGGNAAGYGNPTPTGGGSSGGGGNYGSGGGGSVNYNQYGSNTNGQGGQAGGDGEQAMTVYSGYDYPGGKGGLGTKNGATGKASPTQSCTSGCEGGQAGAILLTYTSLACWIENL